MLRNQAALCRSTGSLEMSVFQMLSAGNIGQSGAPGTTVPWATAWTRLAAGASTVNAATAQRKPA
jgi:hypothetical protein